MKTVGIIYTQIYHSPLGDMILGEYEGKLCLCDWCLGRHKDRTFQRVRKLLNAEFKVASTVLLNEVAHALDEYFAGERRAFDIPILPVGTAFQQAVWNELLQIPYGTTISYAEESKRLGKPKAIRAVASANGANPITIIIPCHRVIGSDGSLVGYGGGLETKRSLLSLEFQG